MTKTYYNWFLRALMLIAGAVLIISLNSGKSLTARADQATAAPTQDMTVSNTFQARIALFKYDNAADLNLKENKVEKRGDVSIHDITFAATPGKDGIQAYLVVPAGTGPFAGILWVHWLGEPETTNRTQFLNEAVALAAKGTVSLLVNAMWSAPNWYENRVPEEDYANSIAQVVQLRRAFDMLISQPNVDKTRIGFVGHDYGAMYGILTAGVDQRAKTYVFIAAASSLYDWAFFGTQPKSKADYITQNAVFELTDYLSQIKNASVLYQYAKVDPYISRTQGAVLFAATNDPKDRKLYDNADHSMTLKEITADRDDWLTKELALK